MYLKVDKGLLCSFYELTEQIVTVNMFIGNLIELFGLQIISFALEYICMELCPNLIKLYTFVHFQERIY